MRFLLLAVLMSVAFLAQAEEKKAAKKKKPEAKASSQDWGNWSKGGNKTLDDKAKKDAAKAKK